MTGPIRRDAASACPVCAADRIVVVLWIVVLVALIVLALSW